MGEKMIQDVHCYPLKKIEDQRGAVMHMLRSDQPHFQKFGEIYFSVVKPGVVKGWKLHKEISQNMAVPEGKIRLVIYDPRENSSSFGKTQVIEFGGDNYCLVQMPPNVWYAFQAISSGHAMIANCTTAPHSPSESETLPLETEMIPYRWPTPN
jgi:dTDP-4-dehydrorhamnose 3,5-epimerase